VVVHRIAPAEFVIPHIIVARGRTVELKDVKTGGNAALAPARRADLPYH
jgi:hypothetical protein